MFFVLSAFVFGLFVPYMARRFAKFMPATFAGALVELLRVGKKNKRYRNTPEFKKLMWRSFMFGIGCALLVFCAQKHFGLYGFGFVVAYLWILVLLAEIDFRMFLLPDILTVPLLLSGLLAASFDMGFVAINESVLGAFAGYFLPVAVSLLIVWRKKDAFGGGDIKLLAAIGAWLGVEGLLYVIMVSSVLGILFAIVMRKKVMAFGPMLAIAGIGVAFWLY